MNYHNITTEDMNNGDGLRSVLWVAGCEHHCEECQNPITWNADGGIPFDEEAKDELIKSLQFDYISGITFSGGDPLATYNRKEVLDVIREIRSQYPEKTIWVYTGYRLEELVEQIVCDSDPWISKILENIDILVDGKYVRECRDVSLKWRGSTNQRVIDVPKTLQAKTVVLHCS